MATARRRDGRFELAGVLHEWVPGYRDSRILLIDGSTPLRWLEWEGRPPTEADLKAHFPEEPSPDPLGNFGSLPSTTLVICSRDRVVHLRRCLESLAQSFYQAVPMLVVDSAPTTSDTAGLVDEMSAAGLEIDYIVEPRPGLSRARNRALRYTKTELVAFTDDDVVPERGWLASLRAAFVGQPHTAMATGLVPPAELETPAQHYFERRLPWSARFEPCRISMTHHPGYGEPFPYAAGQFGAGANMALRRETVLELGGFDEALGAGTWTRGGEDLEMFVRVLRSGHEIAFEPKSIVWHVHPKELTELRRQVFRYGTGLAAYLACLATRPEPLELRRLIPSGLKFTVDSRRSHVDAAMERRLLVREALGLLWGPVAFGLERLLRPS